MHAIAFGDSHLRPFSKNAYYTKHIKNKLKTLNFHSKNHECCDYTEAQSSWLEIISIPGMSFENLRTKKSFAKDSYNKLAIDILAEKIENKKFNGHIFVVLGSNDNNLLFNNFNKITEAQSMFEHLLCKVEGFLNTIPIKSLSKIKLVAMATILSPINESVELFHKKQILNNILCQYSINRQNLHLQLKINPGLIMKSFLLTPLAKARLPINYYCYKEQQGGRNIVHLNAYRGNYYFILERIKELLNWADRYI